jgi:NADH dehydrogenase
MQVLVLGGGYAGLLTAKKLERRLPADATLTLVDDTGDHLVQHELHRVIRKPGYVDDIVVPIADVLDRASVREGIVDDVDREHRTVHLADGSTFDYDYCVVALGAETAYYGIPGVEEYGTPLKRLEHAATIRRNFESLLASGGGTVVIGGAGLSGVQVAGEMATMARERGLADETDVVLVEQEPSVAPAFPENFQRAVREALVDGGVTVRTNATVTEATDSTVRFERGADLDYDQFVWTGGIAGGAALDGERPVVRADFRLDEHTFAVGDAARIVDADGEAVPASASAAVRASSTVAKNVVAAVRAEQYGEFADVRQWNWESPGWLVSIGDDAVAQVGPQVFTGPVATGIKSAVGVTYLAEHGTLRQALSLLREELDDVDDVATLLKKEL